MTNFADRTIWTGDNLDILRGLNSASVDLIYQDPPLNSNRNYAAPVGSAAAGAACKDTWTLSDLDVAWMGLIADEQPAVCQVVQTAELTYGKGMQSNGLWRPAALRRTRSKVCWPSAYATNGKRTHST